MVYQMNDEQRAHGKVQARYHVDRRISDLTRDECRDLGEQHLLFLSNKGVNEEIDAQLSPQMVMESQWQCPFKQTEAFRQRFKVMVKRLFMAFRRRFEVLIKHLFTAFLPQISMTVLPMAILSQRLICPHDDSGVYHAYYGNHYRDSLCTSILYNDIPLMAHDISFHPSSHADDPTCQSSGDLLHVHHELDVPRGVPYIHDQINHHIRESNRVRPIDYHYHAHYHEDQNGEHGISDSIYFPYGVGAHDEIPFQPQVLVGINHDNTTGIPSHNKT